MLPDRLDTVLRVFYLLFDDLAHLCGPTFAGNYAKQGKPVFPKNVRLLLRGSSLNAGSSTSACRSSHKLPCRSAVSPNDYHVKQPLRRDIHAPTSIWRQGGDRMKEWVRRATHNHKHGVIYEVHVAHLHSRAGGDRFRAGSTATRNQESSPGILRRTISFWL